MPRIVVVLTLAVFTLSPTPLVAQQPVVSPSVAATPESLAEFVARSFESDPAVFDGVFPVDAGRAFVADAVRRKARRHSGLARVVSQIGDRAVLALSGYAELGNSGAETLGSRTYSDFYLAERRAGQWVLAERLPLDAENRILAHRIGVTITPGLGMRVVDTLTAAVGTTYGFAARLSHRARISRLTVDGRPAEHAFGAGMLWVSMAPSPATEVVVEYDIDMPTDPDSWLAYFLPTSGFARDQFLWHPVLNYTTAADHAAFRVTLRVPAAFYATLGMAQSSEVVGDERVVRARSELPTPGVSILFDREWTPSLHEADGVRFEIFATPDFAPSPARLDSVFRRTLAVLTARFGPPRSGYFAVAQRREALSGGWHMLSNAAMIAGRAGGRTSSDGDFPRAFVGHEMAHGWTRPTGPGALFLTEGWATFAESYLLADEYGVDTERRFWEAQRKAYESGRFDGATSILADGTNGGVAYSKGAWILRMLRDDLGEPAFLSGLREYLTLPAGASTGIPAFAAALSRASGRDVGALLLPWLEETTIPHVRARIDDNRVILRQDGPLFDLPIELDIVTGAGRVRRTVRLARREIVIEGLPDGSITAVAVDPDRRLLLHR